MYPSIYMRARARVSVCVCYTRIYTYIIHLSVHVRTGRGYVCVHQCAMVMDRPCVRTGWRARAAGSA